MLGRALNTFENCLEGRDILVCGDGPSFHKTASRVKDHLAIAVNRACSKVKAKLALCIENTWDTECWDAVRSMDPAVVFTLNPHAHPKAVRIPGRYNELLGEPFDKNSKKTISIRGDTSPWYAAAVSLYMGAQTVGVIGVDVYGHKELDTPKHYNQHEIHWYHLNRVAENRGQRLINLSDHSKLTTIPFGDWSELK